MVKNHLKRIAAPRTWRIARKKTVYITRANPGAHKKDLSLSLSLMMREMVKVAKSSKEVVHILHHKEVLVDGKRVRDKKRSIGLMDVVNFPELGEAYRITLDIKGKLAAVPIKGEELFLKVCRIEDKSWVKTKRKKGYETMIPKPGEKISL